MRKVHAAVFVGLYQAVLWSTVTPQSCVAQVVYGTSGQGITSKASVVNSGGSFSPAPAPTAGAVQANSISYVDRAAANRLAANLGATILDSSSSRSSAFNTPTAASPKALIDMSQPTASGQAAGQGTGIGNGASAGLDAAGFASGPTAGSGYQSGAVSGGGIASDGSTSAGVGSVSGGNAAGSGVAASPTAASPMAAAVAAAASGATLVFDGAGNLVSGGTGFGDVPSTYTGKQEWPELVGTNALVAKAKLAAETGLSVILVPQGSVVTTDYRADRIRIYFDPSTGVVVQPRPAVG